MAGAPRPTARVPPVNPRKRRRFMASSSQASGVVDTPWAGRSQLGKAQPSASVANGESRTRDDVVGLPVQAEAGPKVDGEILRDEIDEAAHGVMPRAGRRPGSRRVEGVPLDERLELARHGQGRREPGRDITPWAASSISSRRIDRKST